MLKKIIITIFSISLIFMLIGCSHSILDKDNPLGLKLSVSDVSNTGLKLTCQQSNTDLQEEVTTHLKYWVEKYENGKWVELEYTRTAHWDEVTVYTIPKNGEYWWTLFWIFYGELPSGEYRVKKIFEYKGNEYDYYAEFEIE
ncbi:hypothetical protein NMU03_01875 [Allocoprobacillus halotolerans]|uniref:Bacterial Ig-like domain-containing protein n=1 Tax=Allocoprobacillus halotolerans TaxID=2944914 RepID=A0ABY5I2Q6_9FIRM|nr:immunoglobulin-like domain-containing protein [Allocoprobacillus halotolerans]UTY39606.1 hypothetical protein NMU03_01875 [Allocoprobacillus halotolerans]